MDNKLYDAIIVGGGPAGLTAYMYFLMANKNVLCFEKSAPGGKLNEIAKIKNYPSENDITGPQLSKKFFDHILSLNGSIKNEEIMAICRGYSDFVVTSNKDQYHCKNVIISSGTKAGHFGYPNEEKLIGKGVSYCATCDGFFFKQKDVAVVGNNNEAFSSALYLSNIVNKLYLLVGNNADLENPNFINLSTLKNVEIVYDCKVLELVGENLLESVNTNKGSFLVSGCFIFEETKPSSYFYKDLNIKLENGFIVVDSNFETSEKGVYAVGDCIAKNVRQIINASSEGMNAAINIIKKKS